MKIVKIQEVTERKQVLIGFRCDSCGNIHNGNILPDAWHEFSGHHDSWGNDSIDSYEDYLACSPTCYIELLKKAIEDFNEYDTAEIDNFKIDFVKRLVETITKTDQK